MLETKEHYDLMAQFEKNYMGYSLTHEPKCLWSKGILYTNGTVNRLFLAYRLGYFFSKHVNNIGEN